MLNVSLNKTFPSLFSRKLTFGSYINRDAGTSFLWESVFANSMKTKFLDEPNFRFLFLVSQFAVKQYKRIPGHFILTDPNSVQILVSF